MFNKTFFASLVLLMMSFLPASAQKIAPQIGKLIAEEYGQQEPGGAILITKKGDIVYKKGFGKASLELNIANTPEHVFEVGSITKQFTAVAILMLEEAGKLSVNDTISKFLPDYPASGKAITIHQLLTHTSGIPSYTSINDWAAEWRLDKTVDEMIDVFKNKALEFTPGEKWSYSNSGYILLGAIIERVSGINYQEFIETRIFKPAGMTHSYYGAKSTIIANRTAGYQKGPDGSFYNAEYLSMTQPYASGAIMSTVEDQNKWIHAIANNTLISENSKQKAWTNYKTTKGKATNYGYGWMISELYGHKTIEHGGSIFGFLSFGIYIPDEDIYACVLTNRDDQSPDMIAIKAAALAMNTPLNDPQKTSLSAEKLQEYVAIYDFENGTTRTITREENQLYSQRTGGPKLEIYPYEQDKFFFDNSFTRLEFTRNNMNAIGAAVSTTRGAQETAKRTNKEIVALKEIALDPKSLDRFVGDYELDPAFIIKVTVRDGRLFGQATGQPEFELFPKSELVFFLKVVDAEIEFIQAQDGNIEKMILHQGGQDMPGKKR